MAVAPSPLSALRKFAKTQTPEERCELCGATLPGEHQHLIETATRKLMCSCDACAILFDTGEKARFRRIPRDVRWLDDFKITDAQWEGLHLPINLVFIYRSSAAGRVMAMYPGPAGATESQLSLESWDELAAQNPRVAKMQADVEALLINRVGEEQQYWLAPMDQCFRLVGVIRANWHSLSGGFQVWTEIKAFFDDLKKRAGVDSTSGGGNA